MGVLSAFKRCERALIWSSSALLLMAAGSKLYTAASDLRIVELYDPVLLVKYRHLLIGVAFIEVLSVVILLRSVPAWLKGLILMWLGANFILYRAAVVLSGAPTLCQCFGSVGSRLGLSPSTTDVLAKAIVLFLLTAGAYMLYRHGFLDRRNARICNDQGVMKDDVKPALQA